MGLIWKKTWNSLSRTPNWIFSSFSPKHPLNSNCCKTLVLAASPLLLEINQLLLSKMGNKDYGIDLVCKDIIRHIYHDQRDDVSLILATHIQSWMWCYTSIFRAVLWPGRARDRLPRSQQADILEYTAQAWGQEKAWQEDGQPLCLSHPHMGRTYVLKGDCVLFILIGFP